MEKTHDGQPLDFREYKLHVVGDPGQAADYPAAVGS
jgi:hypothetical protein